MAKPRLDPGAEFTTAQADYAALAMQSSGGAAPAAGMAPYPLYGIPLGLGQDVAAEPFYRRPWPMFGVGVGVSVTVIGGLYAYFRWWAPMRKRMKANALKSLKKKIFEIEKAAGVE
jgi:hypothetical protein